MVHYLKELKAALFGLGKVKGYSVTIIATFAVTLGALVAMFNLNYQILGKPLPYPDSEQIFVSKGSLFHGNELEYGGTSSALLLDLHKNYNDKFINLALADFSWDLLRSLPNTPPVYISYVTPSYLKILDFPVLKGRLLNDDEIYGRKSASAVISFATWERHFKKSPDVLGQSIQLGKSTFNIVGVLKKGTQEPSIAGVGRKTDIWVPLDFSEKFESASWKGFTDSIFAVARLNESVNINSLNGLLTEAFQKQFRLETKGETFFDERSLAIEFQTLKSVLAGDTAKSTILMFLGSLVLLLIACGNTLNLMLARAVNRQGIMAIQAALGAKKKHIYQSIITEQLLLFVVASIFALGVAEFAYFLMRKFATSYFPGVESLGFDGVSLLFSISVAVIMAWVCALFIVSKINYRQLQGSLQSSGKGAGIQVSARARYWLLYSQVLLATILLTACLQILFQSVKLMNQAPNFDLKSQYEVILQELRQPTLTDIEERRTYYEQRRQTMLDISQTISDLSSVVDANFSTTAPINYYGDSWLTYLSSDASFSEQVAMETVVAEENYLQTAGIKLLHGRYFKRQEVIDRSAVIILNKKAAEQFGGGQKAIGQYIYWTHGFPNKKYEVVGVVDNLNIPDVQEVDRMWTVQLFEYHAYNLTVKLKPGAQLGSTEINQAIAEISPIWRVWSVHSLADNLAQALKARHIAGYVTLVLAILAFLLVTVGIYGMVSYDAKLQRFQLGVRMSIGAKPTSILKQVIIHNAKPAMYAISTALVVTLVAWFTVRDIGFTLEGSFIALILPILSIVLVVCLATITSIWSIVRNRPIYALRNN